MRTIAITGTDIQLNNAIEKNIGQVEELEIALSMPYGNELVENIAFAQPDFIISDLLSDRAIKTLLDQCLNTTFVFITDDTNRCASVISNFNKEGYFNFINLDKNKIDPKGVLELLKTYEPENGVFEEVNEDTLLTQPEEEVQPEEQTVEQPTEATPEQNDEPLVEKKISDFKPEETVAPPKVDNYANKVNSAKINAVSQCQVVSIYSKKGGTGKSTVAKEMANIFSGVSLPKKLSDKAYLDVCLIDFNFEQADLRTILGISNPNPSLYALIDAYVTRMESGIPLDKIYFSAPEIKTNYCIDVNNGQFKLICLSQGDVPKKLVERILAFQDESMLPKILRRIVKNLKDVFNILIIDNAPSYNDITAMTFKMSSKIVYVMEPCLTDIDNLKTFLDETKDTAYVTNKLVPFVNKNTKSKFESIFFELYEEVIKKNESLAGIQAVAPYDQQIINYNNDYGFYTNNSSKFKQALIVTCSNILPIFKVKNISLDLKVIEQKKKAAAKKEKQKAVKAATDKFNKESKEEIIHDIKNPEDPISSDSASVNDGTEGEELTITKYLSEDLSKKDLETFISDLEKCKGVKKTKKGFPMVTKKPSSLNKKVWKAYYKRLSKNIK